MKTKLFLVCESAVIDRNTNNLSIFNILEEISAQGFPLIIPKLFVVYVLERKESEDASPEFNLRIIQEKKYLFDKTFTVNFQDKMRTRQLIELQGFTLTKSGHLTFRLNFRGKKFAEYSLIINALPGPRNVIT